MHIRKGLSLANGSSGFTLIELLLATCLLVLVLSVAYSSLSHIIKGKSLLDDDRDVALIGDAIISRISRELQLAYSDPNTPLLINPNDPNGSSSHSVGIILQGTPKKLSNDQPGDKLTFLALEGGQYLPDGGAHSGIVQITYRAEEDPDQQNQRDRTYLLVRDEVPYIRPTAKAFNKIMTFPITNRLVRMAFDYYDANENKWVDAWGENAPKELPAMIRFNIAIKSPRGRITEYTSAIYLRSPQN